MDIELHSNLFYVASVSKFAEIDLLDVEFPGQLSVKVVGFHAD